MLLWAAEFKYLQGWKLYKLSGLPCWCLTTFMVTRGLLSLSWGESGSAFSPHFLEAVEKIQCHPNDYAILQVFYIFHSSRFALNTFAWVPVDLYLFSKRGKITIF